MRNVERGELFAAFSLVVSIGVVLAVASFAAGCGGGSKISVGDCEDFPDAEYCQEPSCVEQVTDECVPEVVEEFCAECETCEVCPEPEYINVCFRKRVICDKTYFRPSCKTRFIKVECPEDLE